MRDLFVKIDVFKIDQVVRNILTNAVIFSLSLE